jgi:hypothetical protein
MKRILILVVFAILFAPVFFALAAGNTTGYAWSTKAGWIDFENVSVSDCSVAGSVWTQNFGWVNLALSNVGVANDGLGQLSGSGWGQNLGWLNFDGIAIGAQGNFTGTASGDIVGTVYFTNCGTSCGVQTTWRSSGQACGVITPPGGGGGFSHNECQIIQNQYQCVSVATLGTNECATAGDCNQCDPYGDINKDSYIEMRDFSILLYNWEMPLNWNNNPPYISPYSEPPNNKCADISHANSGDMSGTVDMTDFSIMLYWWTS